MTVEVLKDFLNPPSAEEAPESNEDGFSPYSVAIAQFSALNALYGAYMASTNESRLSLFASSPEIVLLDNPDQNDLVFRAEKNVQKKRELQREIDRETEDFITFLEELTFERVHREIFRQFLLQSA